MVRRHSKFTCCLGLERLGLPAVCFLQAVWLANNYYNACASV